MNNPRQSGYLSRAYLGDILVRKGLISQSLLDQMLAQQQKNGQRLGTLLIRGQHISPEDLQTALQEQVGIAVVDLDQVQPDLEVLGLLPLDTIRRYRVLPLYKENDKLIIVTPDPMNVVSLDSLRFYLKDHKLEIRGCNTNEFSRFMARHFEAKTVVDEMLQKSDQYRPGVNVLEPAAKTNLTPEERQLAEASEQSPIIAMCNYILSEALGRRASDIHIEPGEGGGQVRFRIDGMLQMFLSLPKNVVMPVVARFKIMGSLNIAKKLIPQDGHFDVRYNNKDIHFRLSTLPSVFGEKAVIRILQPNEALMDLGALGLEPHELSLFKRSLGVSQGLILVTGPTGSGKTTTIHTGLAHINRPEVNIVTLEDPVEVTIQGITHVGIHPQAGLGYAQTLRSILRQDPDVIFVGEIREEEVANIAMRAALTGHLVLSTVHTTSAIETVIRMEDLGVPPYLLASALILVIAQRLVRQVCRECAESYRPHEEDLAVLGLDESVLIGATLLKGAGCPKCGGTGYYGRIGVYEFLRMSPEIRRLVRAKASPEQILNVAREQEMVNLIEDGILKMRRGLTTPDELVRVLYREG